MNATGSPTIWSFFSGESGLIGQRLSSLQSDKKLVKIQASLGPKVQGALLSSLKRNIEEGLQDVLSISLTDVIGSTWKHYKEIQNHLDPKSESANEVVLYPVAEHSISISREPKVEILLNGSKVGSIELKLELSIAFDMAILRIQNAKIREIELGSAVGEGTLSCGPATLVEVKSKEIEFPSLIQFEGKDAVAEEDQAALLVGQH